MEELKFDLVDWIQVLFGTALVLLFFFVNCMFLIDPFKWLLVQIIFVIAPIVLGSGYLVRYFFKLN
ncbi:hypothetical protein NQ016_03885 [Staphylococcus hyicus]|uniref:hypothetical protein n=1 Tax=Staphylococcus hyicus TaxID=1284 RepID=UPI00211C3F9B|nr:hypothetical protein [Staphylococcus hyicus]MCQ9290658.1 hypothetical protein [Staphylococcus hyicus]MCQ9305900.1 hypothetical protein [Staphylococcus hyicus]MCQ9308312.1 hypothetical protein [Staphylococcus hyicus]MCQ9310734.1 hypothetical protein [Staphylococcus hyicus]